MVYQRVAEPLSNALSLSESENYIRNNYRVPIIII